MSTLVLVDDVPAAAQLLPHVIKSIVSFDTRALTHVPSSLALEKKRSKIEKLGIVIMKR